MNWKLLIPVILLICLAVPVFAAPAVTSTSPSSGTTITGTTYYLRFTLVDENNVAKSTYPDTLRIWYSTTAGAYTNLIVNDLNLADTNAVVCSPDQNLFSSRSCYYLWSVPSLNSGFYFIDYNFRYTNDGGTTYVYATGSSPAVTISNNSGCGTLTWLAGLITLVIAAFALLQMLGGKLNVYTLAAFAIIVLIGIYVITTFTVGICG